ncbi:hypothetical protein PYCCODRAFT_1391468 [Trametes coccinea BRFM310]|uniref:Uncharacterized protein n=1 Tax=Trametes coccinea (strain BRFM310) TaxID=1353009 RepID=A0A1Y2ILP6_TRAC3|nr:hypothetical protein PYCCODRAFT_1391468 [Trametes coccinea BRFM310]
MSLSVSLDFPDDRSDLPWTDDSSTAPLLDTEVESGRASQTSITSDFAFFPEVSSVRLQRTLPPSATTADSPAATLVPLSPPGNRTTVLSPNVSAGSANSPSVLFELPSLSVPAQSSVKDVEGELRATVDAILKRKKEAQRGLIEENANLREEVAFLRKTIRLASTETIIEPGVDSNKAELAHALEHERTQRLRGEEKLHAVVEYLAEQIASVSERGLTTEKALKISERDCVSWRDKATAAITRGEALGEENLLVKSLLNLFAKHLPSVVQQQMQAMLRELAEERADLRRLEAIERSLDKLGGWHPQTHGNMSGSFSGGSKKVHG